jgi:hypothetical protein
MDHFQDLRSEMAATLRLFVSDASSRVFAAGDRDRSALEAPSAPRAEGALVTAVLDHQFGTPIRQAQNAGVAAVAVSYGAHVLSDLESMRPLCCVGSFAELMQWLKQNA